MTIKLLKITYLFVALSALFSPGARAADFILHANKLMLFSQNVQELYGECRALQDYVVKYRTKNNQTFSANSQDCKNSQFIDLSRESFDLPTYASKDLLLEHLKKQRGFWLEVGSWFPPSLWKRYQNHPQDGVCYNTALVESGVLPEALRSSFLRDVDFFLGLQGRVHVSQEPEQKTMVIFGAKSTSPAIKYRKTWSLNFTEKEKIRHIVNSDIRAHFSPGSILCLSIDQNTHKNELQQIYPDSKFKTNLASLPSSYTTESKGGHCLVFLTPNLISESNQWLPKNLMGWEAAFDFYFETLKNFNTEAHLHYFEIDPTPSTQLWVVDQINSHPPLKALVGLAIKHRKLYESLSWHPCEQPGPPQFYSNQCKKQNPEASKALAQFWKNEGLLLESSLFDQLKNRNHQSWTSSLEDVASSLYEQMMDLKNQTR